MGKPNTIPPKIQMYLRITRQIPGWLLLQSDLNQVAKEASPRFCCPAGNRLVPIGWVLHAQPCAARSNVLRGAMCSMQCRSSWGLLLLQPSLNQIAGEASLVRISWVFEKQMLPEGSAGLAFFKAVFFFSGLLGMKKKGFVKPPRSQYCTGSMLWDFS